MTPVWSILAKSAILGSKPTKKVFGTYQPHVVTLQHPVVVLHLGGEVWCYHLVLPYRSIDSIPMPRPSTYTMDSTGMVLL